MPRSTAHIPELLATVHGKFFDLGQIEFLLKSTEGDVLTIVEATYSDLEQRRAVKCLIKKTINARLNLARDVCHGSHESAA